MANNSIKVGQSVFSKSSQEPTGDFVMYDGAEFYKINHYDHMRPFFMSLVSDSDHWLYISSLGGLTAGRKNPENALFPYYTDDKIHDGSNQTGSKTILLVTKGTNTYLWEPFSDRYEGIYGIQRNLYKNTYGNQLVFEEHNRDLGLTFSYSWSFSQQFGFVKKSRLANTGATPVQMRLLDGMQNLLPYGVDVRFQSERSTLLDAYKKNELMIDSGLGLFLLSSVPVDKAEPSEALKATTVWHTGLEVDLYCLSSNQIDAFRSGHTLEQEVDVRAERGAYFVQSTFELSVEEQKTWYFAAELNQGPSQVFALHEWIRKGKGLDTVLEKDIEAGTQRLVKLVAAADGLQKSTDKMLTTRHFANVLFNIMRGGIFDHHYDAPKNDLIAFIRHFNRKVAERESSILRALPDPFNYSDLKQSAAETGDRDFQRLCLEYLPLIFSRRHGDPSRPWNSFSIELLDDAGKKKFYYQGNWRDIFQNWEALALSFPGYLESMISKFVNASTVDGYNPYRITREGIDWELIDEDDPWSYIGYWGDHQIIYLLKLMELSEAHHPGELHRMLTQKIYAYANVPYRIKDYQDLIDHPHDTIEFDHQKQKEVEERVENLGADGKLVQANNGEILLVNLSEKLLVSLLAKLSNFIPEGGIWLNTQRPEWNDANNALVGYGISMVTMCYIRRFVLFTQSLFAGLKVEHVEVSEEVAHLFYAIAHTFDRYRKELKEPITNHKRREIMDELGQSGGAYRNLVYKGFSGNQESLSIRHLDTFFSHVLACTDHTITANRRPDDLFHSYNLMQVEEDGGIAIRHLYEMLEGQVAVLSAGILKPEEALDLLRALRKSALYRADQHSYILYPDRDLPRFEIKNQITKEMVLRSSLLKIMAEKGDNRIIEKDVSGGYHFNGNFHNQKDVENALKNINDREYADHVQREKDVILGIFEAIFDHQSFTGRSGTFFGYEGLGCIYWHMVSKLLLAAEENCLSAMKDDTDPNLVKRLIEHYYDIRKGIGFNKSPDNYGAFPTDPYSHTPGNAGARQPGMTGQVKEDIMARFGELGVVVNEGQILFKPRLLQRSEFIKKASFFTYYDIRGVQQEIELPANSLVFTYCQVPIIYTLGKKASITIHFKDGKKEEIEGLKLERELSDQLFDRTGKISFIKVCFDRAAAMFI